MHTKHHQERRQKAMALLGHHEHGRVRKSWGGDLFTAIGSAINAPSAPNHSSLGFGNGQNRSPLNQGALAGNYDPVTGQRKVNSPATPSADISNANQMLRNSASEMGAKRGGAIKHHKKHKCHGQSLRDCAYREGGSVKHKHREHSHKAHGGTLSECAYKHGGEAKPKHKYKTHRHEDAAEDRKLIREELKKHDREMQHMPRSKMHHAKKEHKHHDREKFAMGGAGKIRHNQMTMSGKPIPAPRNGRRNVGL